MKWILIYVLYSHSGAEDYRSSNSVTTNAQHLVFDDQRACYSVRDGIKSGALNKSFSNRYGTSSTVTADAACVPQSSTDQLGPLK